MVCKKNFKMSTDLRLRRYPNGVVAHYECGKEDSVCPVTGTVFHRYLFVPTLDAWSDSASKVVSFADAGRSLNGKPVGKAGLGLKCSWECANKASRAQAPEL